MQKWFDQMSKSQRFLLYGLIALFAALGMYGLIAGADIDVVLLFDAVLLILVVYLHLGRSRRL